MEAVPAGGHGNRIIDIHSENHKLNETIVFYCTSPSSLIKSDLHNMKILNFHVSHFLSPANKKEALL